MVEDFQYRVTNHMEEEKPSRQEWGCIHPNIQDLLPDEAAVGGGTAVGDEPDMENGPAVGDKQAVEAELVAGNKPTVSVEQHGEMQQEDQLNSIIRED